MYILGFIEKEGTGIEDIKKTLLDNGNPDIEYDRDGDERDFTSATIYANKEFVEQMENISNIIKKDSPQDNPQDSPQDSPQNEITLKILNYCIYPRSKKEIASYCGYKDVKSFSQRYLKVLLENNLLQMTIPEKPNSKNQKYLSCKSIHKTQTI